MSDDDQGNGTVHHLHPIGDPTRAIAEHTVHRQAATERDVISLEDKVDRIYHGKTDWQIEVRRLLATLTFESQETRREMRLSRFIWPAASVLAALFLGGVTGALVFFLSQHHL